MTFVQFCLEIMLACLFVCLFARAIYPHSMPCPQLLCPCNAMLLSLLPHSQTPKKDP